MQVGTESDKVVVKAFVVRVEVSNFVPGVYKERLNEKMG